VRCRSGKEGGMCHHNGGGEYDLRSGQAKGKVSVRIVNGTVIDRPV
jgi:hypothetical protein